MHGMRAVRKFVVAAVVPSTITEADVERPDGRDVAKVASWVVEAAALFDASHRALRPLVPETGTPFHAPGGTGVLGAGTGAGGGLGGAGGGAPPAQEVRPVQSALMAEPSPEQVVTLEKALVLSEGQ